MASPLRPMASRFERNASVSLSLVISGTKPIYFTEIGCPAVDVTGEAARL